MPEIWDGPLEKVDAFRWRIPKEYKRQMKTDGLIFADKAMIEQVRKDQAPAQVTNVAHLPGIVGSAMAMPDIHCGYGFPIGGVAAFDAEEGIVSPGGVGYDINCGVRLMRSNLTLKDIESHKEPLIEALFRNIPCGVGSKSNLKLSNKEEREVIAKGAAWAVEKGMGWASDLEHTENRGCLESADPKAVSSRALERGRNQVGTLGSGNHFLEIQEVVSIFDKEKADAFGLQKGQIVVMLHSGSRGFGYQVCDDSLDHMMRNISKYKMQLPDKQLISVPIKSPDGEKYLSAMASAANYAWANRQVMMHRVRKTFEEILSGKAEHMGLHLVYDVAHNIAKFETHQVNKQERKLLVHRKGATRAFGPGLSNLPKVYQKHGQPVIIPGDMGTASYVLAGTDQAMEETFGSTCHGAGRMMSRHGAIKASKGRQIEQELADQGVLVRHRGRNTLAEEMPEAYKDIDHVVNIVHQTGISTKVAKMRPLAVVKG